MQRCESRMYLEHQYWAPKMACHAPQFICRTALDTDRQRGRRVRINVTRTKPAVSASKSGQASRHRNAGRFRTLSENAVNPERGRKCRWHQIPRYPEGEKSISRSRINGVALCIAAPVPLIMIGLYIPRIPTQGRCFIKQGTEGLIVPASSGQTTRFGNGFRRILAEVTGRRLTIDPHRSAPSCPLIAATTPRLGVCFVKLVCARGTASEEVRSWWRAVSWTVCLFMCCGSIASCLRSGTTNIHSEHLEVEMSPQSIRKSSNHPSYLSFLMMTNCNVSGNDSPDANCNAHHKEPRLPHKIH